MTEPIDLYFWPTPNGFKITIALEEMGLPYRVKLVNIGTGEQFDPDFLKIAPNNRMPAIVDPEGPDGAPISVFESGAILQYLARKTGKFTGPTERDRVAVDEWLMWQMGGVGPMAGQAHHFLHYAPNNRMPAIVDPEGPDGAPISVFESGAILQYLARKTGKFTGPTERDRVAVDEWLMWQMGGVGPMAGQAHHFLHYAPSFDPPQDLPYAKDRYRREVGRLYGVLDRQLATNRYVAGDFLSIADFAIWPWARVWHRQEQTMDDKPHMARWLDELAARPAFEKGKDVGKEARKDKTPDRRAQEVLFGLKAAG